MHKRTTADAIVEQADAAANHQLSFFLGLPRKPKAWSEVVLGRPRCDGVAVGRCQDSGGRRGIVVRVVIGHNISNQTGTGRSGSGRWNGNGCKLCQRKVGEVPVLVRVTPVVLPAKTQVEGQA